MNDIIITIIHWKLHTILYPHTRTFVDTFFELHSFSYPHFMMLLMLQTLTNSGERTGVLELKTQVRYLSILVGVGILFHYMNFLSLTTYMTQFAQLYESISKILSTLLNSGAASVSTIGAEVSSTIGDMTEMGGPAAMETIEAATSEIIGAATSDVAQEIVQEAVKNGVVQDTIDITIFLNVIKGLLPFVL